MRSLSELPEKNNDIETNDNEIDSGKILRTNGISDGNHIILSLMNIVFLLLDYKKKTDSSSPLTGEGSLPAGRQGFGVISHGPIYCLIFKGLWVNLDKVFETSKDEVIKSFGQ
jgi:hypothetical protein